jgi:hypothetical protein
MAMKWGYRKSGPFPESGALKPGANMIAALPISLSKSPPPSTDRIRPDPRYFASGSAAFQNLEVLELKFTGAPGFSTDIPPIFRVRSLRRRSLLITGTLAGGQGALSAPIRTRRQAAYSPRSPSAHEKEIPTVMPAH